MPNVVGREGVTAQETMDALRQQLGEGYTFVPIGDNQDAFKVKKGMGLEAKVHVRPQPGATQIHVSSAGFIIGRLINEVAMVRPVAAALKKAPSLRA